MRYGIFSDIHSNLEALNAIVDAYKKEKIDKYLCIGDIVGYASNPVECIRITKELIAVSVAGNHDWASVNLFPLEYFNPHAKEAISWTRENLGPQERYFLESMALVYKNEDLTIVHGTLDNPQEFNYLTDSYIAEGTFGLMNTNICFIGHTHVAGIFIQDNDGQVGFRQDDLLKMEPENKYIVNVGSVGQPRDKNPKAAYCVYDSDNNEVWIKRIDYDIETARKKIIDAGLPRFLGDRLLAGR